MEGKRSKEKKRRKGYTHTFSGSDANALALTRGLSLNPDKGCAPVP